MGGIELILIVCVDDNNGMMFNKRRQSQDRILREQIVNETQKSRLWLTQYSYSQFKDTAANHIIVDDEFLNKAADIDYCYVENMSACQYEDKIDKIILYKWNRKYPTDFWFDIPLKDGWKLVYTEDFKGYSHEKITKEVYTK